MSVRVRFAPSPTGYLHIGGARTALYNYLFAKANNGTFVIRIEDTDLERSTSEFEQLQLKDLDWLGLNPDEGPTNPGDYGPYRQSERSEIYQKWAQHLEQSGKAFKCFCTEEVLEQKKQAAMEAGKNPHYDGTCRELSSDVVAEKVQQGEPYVVRFKVPDKEFTLHDLVRGEVTFPRDMVGDFVMLRTGGVPVYNFCCVVDDWQMKISHVIRGEDHLNNTLRQLMIYEALEAPLPQFAHVSLLVGSDRQKLSKRHGATSVTQYKEQYYLPQALLNYLCLLGWSHPEEKNIFKIDEIVSLFDPKRFSKSHAEFNIEKLDWTNGQHLKSCSPDVLFPLVNQLFAQETLWNEQSDEWKNAFIQLYLEKVDVLSQFSPFLSGLFANSIEKDEQFQTIMSWDTTKVINDYLAEKIAPLLSAGRSYLVSDEVDSWMNELKKEQKIKGKNLFMGLRANLTGKSYGADLKTMATLIPIKNISNHLTAISALFS